MEVSDSYGTQTIEMVGASLRISEIQIWKAKVTWANNSIRPIRENRMTTMERRCIHDKQMHTMENISINLDTSITVTRYRRPINEDLDPWSFGSSSPEEPFDPVMASRTNPENTILGLVAVGPAVWWKNVQLSSKQPLNVYVCVAPPAISRPATQGATPGRQSNYNSLNPLRGTGMVGIRRRGERHRLERLVARIPATWLPRPCYPGDDIKLLNAIRHSSTYVLRHYLIL